MNGKQAPSASGRPSTKSLRAALTGKPVQCRKCKEHIFRDFEMLHEGARALGTDSALLIIDKDKNYIQDMVLICRSCKEPYYHHTNVRGMRALSEYLVALDKDYEGMATTLDLLARRFLPASEDRGARVTLGSQRKDEAAPVHPPESVGCLKCGRRFASYRLLEPEKHGGQLTDQEGNSLVDLVLICGECHCFYSWHSSVRVRVAESSGVLESRLADLEHVAGELAASMRRRHTDDTGPTVTVMELPTGSKEEHT